MVLELEPREVLQRDVKIKSSVGLGCANGDSLWSLHLLACICEEVSTRFPQVNKYIIPVPLGRGCRDISFLILLIGTLKPSTSSSFSFPSRSRFFIRSMANPHSPLVKFLRNFHNPNWRSYWGFLGDRERLHSRGSPLETHVACKLYFSFI